MYPYISPDLNFVRYLSNFKIFLTFINNKFSKQNSLYNLFFLYFNTASDEGLVAPPCQFFTIGLLLEYIRIVRIILMKQVPKT